MLGLPGCELSASRCLKRTCPSSSGSTLPDQALLQILDPHIYGNAFVSVIRGTNTPWSSFDFDDAVFHRVVAVYLPPIDPLSAHYQTP